MHNVFLQVFQSWSELAHVLRDSYFTVDDQDKIDVFDWKVSKVEEFAFLFLVYEYCISNIF